MKLKLISIITCLMISSSLVHAKDFYIPNLTIKKIRVVGNYTDGTVSDDVLALEFNELIKWGNYPNSEFCDHSQIVYIDATKKHLVGAAYMAVSTGKKININADDGLPIRYLSCEISYLDIIH